MFIYILLRYIDMLSNITLRSHILGQDFISVQLSCHQTLQYRWVVHEIPFEDIFPFRYLKATSYDSLIIIIQTLNNEFIPLYPAYVIFSYSFMTFILEE